MYQGGKKPSHTREQKIHAVFYNFHKLVCFSILCQVLLLLGLRVLLNLFYFILAMLACMNIHLFGMSHTQKFWGNRLKLVFQTGLYPLGRSEGACLRKGCDSPFPAVDRLISAWFPEIAPPCSPDFPSDLGHPIIHKGFIHPLNKDLNPSCAGYKKELRPETLAPHKPTFSNL